MKTGARIALIFLGLLYLASPLYKEATYDIAIGVVVGLSILTLASLLMFKDKR